jgi:hypothetical protein
MTDRESHYVNGTAARQNDVLDKMLLNGIVEGFTDPLVFKCRYMVDTFKTYIEPSAKSQLETLASKAMRFPVLTPMVFYHDLLASKNPDFKNLAGSFEMDYVRLGANPYKPSTNTFSWPMTSTAYWLIPVMNVTYNDGFGERVIPATGLLGKAYYSKHTGSAKVYDIVAGQDWPISATGVTGAEFEPGTNQRAAMEKMGVNVIMKIDGVLQLRSSVTAYQSVKSALNHPESLEKVLFVDDYVEPIMNGKLFKYSEPDTWSAILLRANAACDMMLSDGAIGDYKNTCDASNNTVEVRSEGIVLLDTELYNEFGIRIAVHRNTLKLPTTSKVSPLGETKMYFLEL